MDVMAFVGIGVVLVVVLAVVVMISPGKGPSRRTSLPKKPAPQARPIALLVLGAALLGAAAMGAPAIAQEMPVQPLPANPQRPALTNDEVVEMVKAGFAEETIVKAIHMSDTRFDTSVAALLALKKSGVSEKVITAMLDPKPRPMAAVAPEPAKAAPPARDLGLPEEAGVYLLHDASYIEVTPEVFNWRSGGFAKTLLLGTRGHKNGVLKDAHSPLQVGTPVEFLIRCPESVAITEYQLIKFWEKKDRREFRLWTGGFVHESTGADANRIRFEFVKVAPRTYKIKLPPLAKGEYGFLPPGTGQVGFMSMGMTSGAMQTTTTSMKIHTFTLLE